MLNSKDISHSTAGCFDSFREQSSYNPDLFPGSLAVLRHADVMRVLEDHETYSNQVSQHLSIPNGMDSPEHTPFRKMIEPYFSSDRMEIFAPSCQKIARELINAFINEGEIEVMQKLAAPYVLGTQCAWMGWPETIHKELWAWWNDTRNAIKTGDRSILKVHAAQFTRLVQAQIDDRRERGGGIPQDITTELMKEQVEGRPITDTEIISILRNWTAGEVGTLSSSVAILMNFCAEHPEIQKQLRENQELLDEAIDEILRLHAPLVSNRRVTRCPVNHGDTTLPEKTKFTVVWEAANRDPAVFSSPDKFQWDRDPEKNLLWGKGIHVCPGIPLAKLQLRTFMEELLSLVPDIRPGKRKQAASFPGAGFEELFLQFQ